MRVTRSAVKNVSGRGMPSPSGVVTMISKEQWYNAVLLLEAVHPDERGIERLLERRVIVVRASSEEEALRRADEHCGAADHEYRNVHGNRMQWQCRSVVGVTPLFDGEIVDGTEVFWELLGADDEGTLRGSQ
jgi:hypothetical protein